MPKSPATFFFFLLFFLILTDALSRLWVTSRLLAIVFLLNSHRLSDLMTLGKPHDMKSGQARRSTHSFIVSSTASISRLLAAGRRSTDACGLTKYFMTTTTSNSTK